MPRACPARRTSERLLTLDLNDTDWIPGAGGYYYYRGTVDPKAATSKLYNHVTFSKDMGNEYQNATVHIYVTAEAVQTANLGQVRCPRCQRCVEARRNGRGEHLEHADRPDPDSPEKGGRQHEKTHSLARPLRVHAP